MKVVDYRVPPTSWDSINQKAYQLRNSFGLATVERFPIIQFIERVLDQQLQYVRFEICDAEEMNGAEGYTCPSGEFIRLREDVYLGALSGNGRDNFTAAHELGHLMLHKGVILQPLERSTKHCVPAYMLAEPQANQYAAGLLMPEYLISKADSAETMMDRFGVSVTAAENRLNYLTREGKIQK